MMKPTSNKEIVEKKKQQKPQGHPPSVLIRIRIETYQALESIAKHRETFDQIINRLLERKSSGAGGKRSE